MVLDADRTSIAADASSSEPDLSGLRPNPEVQEPEPPASSGPSPAVRLLFLALSAALIGGAIWALSPSGGDSSSPTAIADSPGGAKGPPRAGAPLPPIEMTTVDGRVVNLGDLKGKRVVLNFWATWCPPCRAELPDLARIYEEQRSQGLEVIAIDVQENEPQVSRYLRDIGGLPFTVGLDEDGTISRRFGVSSLPTSLFVDDEGVIRVTFVGGMNASTIQRKLSQVVEEQEYAKSQAQK